MGEYLHREGYTCLGIRLPGHATHPIDMIRSRWTDWTASLEDGFRLLQGVSDRIVLAGLSMGGVLALLMSTRLDAAGVIAMSTPYELPGNAKYYPLWLVKLASRVMPFAPKSSEPPGASWFDKDACVGQVSYPRNPVRSVAELKTLLGRMRAALPGVTRPVLLIHSTDDRYVLPENMEKIYRGLENAAQREKRLVSGSGHVITRDASRIEVFKASAEFIAGLER